MDQDESIVFWVLVAGAIGVLIWQAQNIGDAVTAITSGWQSVEEGPTWVPVINQSEAANGIPTNLLARMAYQESHFRPDIISGATASSDGALGILQMLPQYFASVTVPTPFSAADTTAQISQAAAQLASLYAAFNDWTLAIAGYEAGEQTVKNYLAGTGELGPKALAYVADVIGDVPVAGLLA
jgi:soluble lytic murein transglycosylase-like protein